MLPGLSEHQAREAEEHGNHAAKHEPAKKPARGEVKRAGRIAAGFRNCRRRDHPDIGRIDLLAFTQSPWRAP